MRIWWLGILLSVTCVACSDDDVPIADAAVDTILDGRVETQVEAPLPPAVECPPGWLERDGACAAFEDELPTCTGATALFPGNASCVSIGECPDGAWPNDLPDGTTRYVTPGGTGSGSADDPMGSINAAFASGASVVALSAGTFMEAVNIPAGGKLVGLCAERSILVSELPDTFSGVVTFRGNGGSVQDVTLRGARPGLWDDGFQAEASNVIIDSATLYGVASIFGAELRLQKVVIKNTQSDDTGRFGYGALVAEMGRLTGDFVSIVGNKGQGIGTSDGTRVTLRDTLIAKTGPHAGGRFGEGISANENATIELQRVSIRENLTCGLTINDGSTLIANTLEIGNTRERVADGFLGCGLATRAARSVEVSGALIHDNRYIAVQVSDCESFVLRDSVLHTSEASASDEGTGLGVLLDNSTSTLTRISATKLDQVGLLIRGGTATLEDLRVSDSQASGDIQEGKGIEINAGATVQLLRVEISKAKYAGIFIIDSDSSLTASHLRILDTMQRPCETGACPGLSAGDGLVVLGTATVALQGVEIARSARSGIYIDMVADVLLKRGRVVEQPVGVFVINPDFDVQKISEDVIYDNDRNFARERVAAPERISF